MPTPLPLNFWVSHFPTIRTGHLQASAYFEIQATTHFLAMATFHGARTAHQMLGHMLNGCYFLK